MLTIPTSPLGWLPPILEDADIETLKKTAYRVFKQDLIAKPITIDGKPLIFSNKMIRDVQMSSDVEEDFTHIIVGSDQPNIAKLPSKDRCRYITWVKPILDNCSSEEIITWETERHGKIMKCLAPRDFSSIVVMREGKRRYFFITAYPAIRSHTSESWKREYEDYAQKHRPPS